MIDTPERTCFTIMPFGGWQDQYYKTVYKPAIAEAGLLPQRADDLSRASTIINDIWAFTKEATIVLADLTEENPNVFYELGLAHALAKPVVLVASSIEEVPFDLRALRILIYDRNDPHWGELLKKEIVKSIGELLIAPTKSVLPTFLTVEDMPDRLTISPQEKELLQLRGEFEAFRRQLEVRPLFIQERTVRNLAAHSGRRTSWSKALEHKLLPEVRNQITAGISKGAPDGSIVKRLMKIGVPETRAWQFVNKYAERVEETSNNGIESDE